MPVVVSGVIIVCMRVWSAIIYCFCPSCACRGALTSKQYFKYIQECFLNKFGLNKKYVPYLPKDTKHKQTNQNIWSDCQWVENYSLILCKCYYSWKRRTSGAWTTFFGTNLRVTYWKWDRSRSYVPFPLGSL